MTSIAFFSVRLAVSFSMFYARLSHFGLYLGDRVEKTSWFGPCFRLFVRAFVLFFFALLGYTHQYLTLPYVHI